MNFIKPVEHWTVLDSLTKEIKGTVAFSGAVFQPKDGVYYEFKKVEEEI